MNDPEHDFISSNITSKMFGPGFFLPQKIFLIVQ